MKEKFLALVNDVKGTGIADALCKAINADEIRAAWQKFKDENPDLFTRITDWATEFVDSNCGEIFEAGAEVEMPIETAVCIYIMGETVTECEVFENYGNLVTALYDIGEENAEALGKLVDENYLYSITPEDIFNADSDDDEETETEGEDADADEFENGEEEAECGEESDADEADSDETEVDADEAAQGADSDDDGGENEDEADPDDGNNDGKAESEDGEEEAECGEESDADEADSDETEVDADEAAQGADSDDDGEDDAEEDFEEIDTDDYGEDSEETDSEESGKNATDASDE